ncbi:hypothetical protein QEN19_000472 [Hanseniaspora menglaensis]
MVTRILQDRDIIYDPATGKPLVKVLHNKEGKFNGLDYEEFFKKISFHVYKDIHVNPEFHTYLNKVFAQNGLTDQKEFKRTVSAFKKVIEGCYLECKSRDDVFDKCKFRVSFRKNKDTQEWKVFSNTVYLDYRCTCGISPELLEEEMDFATQINKNMGNSDDKYIMISKKPVNYYKSLKKFSIEKPGTLSFAVLRQFISTELTRQMDVSKSFKVQVRRTGGSKMSDYAFVECFSSDNKDKKCKFKFSVKRNKSTNIWMLDETSTRKVYDCICANNTDINDEEGNVINNGEPRLEIDEFKNLTTKKFEKTSRKKNKSVTGDDHETASEYFTTDDVAKEGHNITDDAITELTKDIIAVQNDELKNVKPLRTSFNDNSVDNFLEAAIDVVQSKDASDKLHVAGNHIDNVFEEKDLNELAKDVNLATQLTSDYSPPKKRKLVVDGFDSHISKKFVSDWNSIPVIDYYKPLHKVIFSTDVIIGKNEISDILHEELRKLGISRRFECSLKSKTREFTNVLYLSCPKQCGFKAIFRRKKNFPWSLYSKSKIGCYNCGCFLLSGEGLKSKVATKIPVIGQ